jgi:hypothetical protein
MGQAQSGQNAFPGQGQQGEKKDQARCPADVALSTSASAFREQTSDVIQHLFCLNISNHCAWTNVRRLASAPPLKLLACLLCPTEGEEEMGAAAASTAGGEEAAPVCTGKAASASCWPAQAALSLHHYMSDRGPCLPWISP